MTSIPASRSARAMIFAPRSWPSSPGLAIKTRIFFSAILLCDLCELCGESVGHFESLDSILEERDIEIDQQSELVPRQFQIGKNDCLMDRAYTADTFQFNYNS